MLFLSRRKIVANFGVVPIREVGQAELEGVIALHNKLLQLKKMYEETAADILRRIQAGAEVEAGTHIARITRRQRGPLETIRLQVY